MSSRVKLLNKRKSAIDRLKERGGSGSVGDHGHREAVDRPRHATPQEHGRQN
jgi:hypothetical protein